MAFTPFDASDFAQTAALPEGGPIPDPLATKIEELRQGLGTFPEFQLDFFRKRIVRRPGMRGDRGLVFGYPRAYDGHWFLFVVGGDQDQVQLNVGMFGDYIRVGMGFIIGRQVAPKIPAFYILQSFLGMRPPLPFRDAFHNGVQTNNFQIEGLPTRDADELLHRLETYVVPTDETTVFVFVGALWDVTTASSKTLVDYRGVFLQLMPFYEELLLAGGRYAFHI
jgi:hypothetical protein